MSLPTCSYCRLLLLCIAVIFVSGCGRGRKKELFTELKSNESGIHFSNDLNDNDSSVSFINEFGYMTIPTLALSAFALLFAFLLLASFEPEAGTLEADA